MKQKTIHLLALLFFVCQSAMAQEKKTTPSEPAKKDTARTESKKTETLELEPENVENQFLNALDYPELQVVPKASERLQMDGTIEHNNGYMMFWPFLAASGTTMVAALMHKGRFKPSAENDEAFRKYADFKVNAAAGLSAAWFAATYFISASEPYNSALSKINQIKGKDKKSLLLKERLAEEAMQKPAELMKMLAYISTATNFIAAAGLIDVVNEDYNLYAGVAILTSFLPIIFKSRYVENYDKHLEYKRKIYAPVVYTDFYKPNVYAEWSPRLVVQWNF
ncbi:MAG: hypothetical protein JNL11_04725 [Bdellovibrionaceae bacterium]|nr:hypothetical protein [Pseudobdellovibrionaceae bacterium]